MTVYCFVERRVDSKGTDNSKRNAAPLCQDALQNEGGGLADGGHGGAEEGFEVAGGVGVFGDGGFDGLLRDGAGVAEVDQGGEGVVAGGAVVWASGGGGDGYGEVVEFVFELEDDALGGLFADAGDAGEGGVVAGADGGDEAVGVDAAEDRDGELGADAGDGEELFEEAFFLGLGEAEEGDLVFADVGVDVEGGFGAFVREARRTWRR